jgi:hypothetical protein
MEQLYVLHLCISGKETLSNIFGNFSNQNVKIKLSHEAEEEALK